MKKLGLIGYPLRHSFSKDYFSEKFRKEGLTSSYSYENFPIKDLSELLSLIDGTGDLKGFNVTIPYKVSILPYLHSLSETAAAVGAVNTVVVEKKRGSDVFRLKGYNTDVLGFEEALLKFIGKSRPSALVLGTGGSSRAVCYVLDQLGIGFKLVSRNRSATSLSYDQLDKNLIRNHLLIINTTPLGMFPDTGSCPDIPYGDLTPDHFLFDLIYNPVQTLFMKKGEHAGAAVTNGLEMLHLQAEAAWRIWTGQSL